MFGFGSGFNDYNRGHETTPNPPIPGKRSLSDMLMILGAGLKDSSSPEANNLGMVTQMQDQKRKEMLRLQQAQGLQQSVDGLGGNITREGLFKVLAPALIQQGNYGALAGLVPQEEKPQIVEGPDGIYAVSASGESKKLQDYPAKPEPMNFGWTRGPDGQLAPLPGGPADPNYIAKTTGVRRDAIVARPMPRAARSSGGGGGGGSGFTGLPPGYRPRAR